MDTIFASTGFVKGWALSKGCFERQSDFIGNEAGHYTPMLYTSHKAMSMALLRDEVRLIILPIDECKHAPKRTKVP